MTLRSTVRGFFGRRKGERRVKAPMVFQMEIAECGAASLAMVLAYYGCHVSLEELRAACGVSRNGSIASLIMRAARSYGLKAAGYKMPVEKLVALPLPAILHWDFNHFVVFEGRIGTRCYIADPAQGPVRMEQDEFIRHYTGVALAFQPDDGFRPRGKRRGVLATLLPLLGRVRGAAAVIAWAGLLLVLPGLLVPTMLRVFIDDVMVGKQEWLAPLLLAFGLTVIAQALLVWLEQLAMRRGELQLASQTTVEMLRRLFTLPMDFFAQRHSAVLQQQVAANSTIAGAVFGQLAGNAINVLTAAFFLALMCGYSVFLSGVAVVAAAMNILLLRLVNERRQTLNQSLMMENTRQLSLTVTGIAMMESLRASGRGEAFFNEWSSSLAAYVMARQAMQRSSALFDMLPSLLYGVSGVVILCFGAWRIIEGDMTLGSMMAFNALLACFVGPITSLTAAGAELQEIKGAAERVEDVMLHSPEKRFAPEADHAEEELAAPEPLALELRDICFGYSRFEKPLIRDFSLTLEPGGWTALVGPSGSGKSTVAKLASGLYAPWSGQVLLGGRPMEERSRSWCNRRIACVDQHILLFSGSIADNVTLYHKAVDPKLLHAALRDACMSDELARRGGLSELAIAVGEAGNNFSGGQRQRLEIARALALSAPVLILDEATSALDPGTEHQVYEAVRKRGCSCLVIAHRLSAIRDCDEIIVMEDGRAVERGRHDDLMAHDGAYRRLMQTM